MKFVYYRQQICIADCTTLLWLALLCTQKKRFYAPPHKKWTKLQHTWTAAKDQPNVRLNIGAHNPLGIRRCYNFHVLLVMMMLRMVLHIGFISILHVLYQNTDHNWGQFCANLCRRQHHHVLPRHAHNHTEQASCTLMASKSLGLTQQPSRQPPQQSRALLPAPAPPQPTLCSQHCNATAMNCTTG